MKKPAKYRQGAGYSLPAAAAALEVSYATLRRAIELKQIRVIDFGGLQRIPPAEIERLRREFELDSKEDKKS
jgi:hypothetical protein